MSDGENEGGNEGQAGAHSVPSVSSSQPSSLLGAQQQLPSASPQVVYISRERKIKKFSGKKASDEEKAEDFVDNVRSHLSARHMTELEKTDFIFSLLESPAKEEVKLRPTNDRNTADKIFTIILEAFGERRTTPQLLRTFYERRQKDGETLRTFSHALCELYDRVKSRTGCTDEIRDMAIRDQFADNVKDSLLRKELRRIVRSQPATTFLELREEALLWAEEGEQPPQLVKKNASLQETSADQSDMTRVLQALEEQRKTIDSLTQALTTMAQKTQYHETGNRFSSQRRNYTNNYSGNYNYSGNDILCFKCRGVGHKARHCPSNQPYSQETIHQPTKPDTEKEEPKESRPSL